MYPSIRNTLAALFTLSLAVATPALFAVEEGEQIPDFDLPSIYAGQDNISLASLEGKTLYVDFWASWCAPCLVSLPQYNELYLKYRDQGLELSPLTSTTPLKMRWTFSKKHHWTFPFLQTRKEMRPNCLVSLACPLPIWSLPMAR